MLSFQHLSAKLPVDKFNGFRGLHESATVLPPPDYARPEEELIEEVAVWLLGSCPNLLPLALGLKSTSFELPSWVPDISAHPPIDVNYFRGQIELYMTYSVKQPGKRFDYQRPGKLCMSGQEVAQVASVCATILDNSIVANHVRMLREWFAFATSEKPPTFCNDMLNDNDCFSATMLGSYVKNVEGSGLRKATATDYTLWQHAVLEMEQNPSIVPSNGLQMKSHLTAVTGRALFKTRDGWLCTGPPSIRPGDVLWLFNGGNAPFATRALPLPEVGTRRPRVLSEVQHQLLGWCYHYGLVEGHVDIAAEARRRSSVPVVLV